METIVPPIGERIAFYNDLYEWAKSFDDDPDDTDFDALSYLEGYPDIPRCDGNKLYFISTVLDGHALRVTHDEVNATEREILTRFFEKDFTMYFELLPCRWEAFDAAERAIAFRDGGYVYTIWKSYANYD